MNGQEVQLKNPGTRGLADFLKLGRSMSRVPKDAPPEKFIEYLDDDTINSLVKLINLTLEKTFPNLPEEERDAWGMKNSMLLIPEIVKMCSPKNITDDMERKAKLMEKLNANKSS